MFKREYFFCIIFIQDYYFENIKNKIIVLYIYMYICVKEIGRSQNLDGEEIFEGFCFVWLCVDEG